MIMNSIMKSFDHEIILVRISFDFFTSTYNRCNVIRDSKIRKLICHMHNYLIRIIIYVETK